MWIEIFRSGRQTDSSGKTEEYSDKMLDEMVNLYNAKTMENTSYEAPIVKGHPKTNDPAYGWVDKLKRRGNILMARLKNVAEDFVEEVRQGRFRRISAAFYPDMMLRHIGFLGAAVPAVKGLEPVCFSDDDFLEYSYEKTGQTGKMAEKKSNGFIKYFNKDRNIEIERTDIEYSESDFLRKELAVLKQKLFDCEKQSKEKEFTEFLEDLNTGCGGRHLTPSQIHNAINLLSEAQTADSYAMERGEFSDESGLTKKIMEFIADLKHSFPMGEFAFEGITTGKFSSSKEESDFSGKSVSAERLEIHDKAMELLSRSPGLCYEEAVMKIINN